MGTLARVDVDLQQIEETVRSIARPKGVGDSRVEFGLDHSGDESAYIYFSVDTALKLTSTNVKRLAVFSRELLHALYGLRMDLLFYIRFEDAA